MNLDNPLLAGFIDTPSLVSGEHQALFENCLNLFLRLEHADEMLAAGMAAGDNFWPEADSWQASYRPYNVQNGILSIPIQGVLLNNFSYATSWATGYQYIARAWQRGQADPDVKGIALVVDSPGGHASGNFDLVDRMAADKGNKPVWAIVEHAYSAAYNAVSPADEIRVSRTGGTGSIGVVTGHMDVSEAMKKSGYKMTLVSAPEGGDKTAQSPYAPLSEDARQRMQDKVDELYGHFVGSVSRNRGMSEKDVRDTQARTFSASQSLAVGLADKISSPDESMAAFSASLSPKETSMSTKPETVEMAVHEAAVASARTEGHSAGRTEGHTAGLKEGATAERERVNAILVSDEAKDRPVAALQCALKTGMSTDEAKGFLGALPKEAAAAPAREPSRAAHAEPLFREAMNASGGAGVKGGEGGAEGAQAADPDDAGPTLAFARAAGIIRAKN